MAWLVVNKNGEEIINKTPPKRDFEVGEWDCFAENVAGWYDDYSIFLPKGSIKKLIGRDLTWEDEPVELK